MLEMKAPKYFCAGLTEKSFRPVPNAEFEIQILNDIGQGQRIVFFNYASNEVLAVWDAMKGRLLDSDHKIPEAVIEAIRNRCNWPGYHLDEDGEITLPSFLRPTKENLEAVRKQTVRKSGDQK